MPCGSKGGGSPHSVLFPTPTACPSVRRTRPQPSGAAMKDSSVSDSKSTQKHRLSQKQKTLVSGTVFPQPQVRTPVPHLCILKYTIHSAEAPPPRVASSQLGAGGWQGPGPPGLGRGVPWAVLHLETFPAVSWQPEPLPAVPCAAVGILERTSSLHLAGCVPNAVLGAGMTTANLPRSFPPLCGLLEGSNGQASQRMP